MDQVENQNRSDEIDLGALFTKIGSFFKGMGLGAIRFLAMIRNVPLQNRMLFSGLLIAGGLCAFIYSSLIKKKFYESSMILSSEYINKRIVDNAIEKLNLLADEESSRALALTLHISDTLAANIAKFESKPFIAESDFIEIEVLKEQLKNAQGANKNQVVIDQVIRRIEIENRHAFEFKVRTYSATSIKPLQDALVNYFRDNDYIRKRLEIGKTNLGIRKTKLLIESQKLDSLKRVIYANYQSMADKQSRQGSNNVILSDKSVTNPLEIYAEDLLLNDQILDIDRHLYLQPDFEVVDGFTQFDEPASTSMPKMVIEGMLIGLTFGYLLVALRHFDKYLSEVK